MGLLEQGLHEVDFLISSLQMRKGRFREVTDLSKLGIRVENCFVYKPSSSPLCHSCVNGSGI